MEHAKKTMGEGTVLVPVDYSDNSIQACRYAARIALKTGYKIQLFHTFYSPAFDLIELTGGMYTQHQLRTDVTEKLMEDEKKQIEDFKSQLSKFPEFSELDSSRIETLIETGIAREEIISYAQKSNPQFVVIGAQGSEKNSSHLLGNVTEQAITKLKVPVLVIPEEYNFSENQKTKKIVYLTNFDESDFVSIKKLIRFADYFNLSIHCIHIGPNRDKWDLIKMEGLKDYFNKAYKRASVECHILDRTPDLIQTVDKYVTDNKIDMLALTHHQRNIIGLLFKPSVTKRVFYHTKTPLLVFHS